MKKTILIIFIFLTTLIFGCEMQNPNIENLKYEKIDTIIDCIGLPDKEFKFRNNRIIIWKQEETDFATKDIKILINENDEVIKISSGRYTITQFIKEMESCKKENNYDTERSSS